ncbi:methyltransferase domain-containing protein [Cupriavidus basilensis]|uniref:methyltransferase domain-containing protein n=1 Tax=Cupriavidus basilensis TaxID=68895 RepID=UPI0007510ED3|nr:methyltransferase domain-containing protein [Cupriavidus basilensis]
MGIDVYVLDFLLRTRRSPLGQTLWLGRQGFHIGHDQAPAAQRVLALHAPGTPLAAIAGTTGYAESLFAWLGASAVTAMDHSAYEGAALLHDLNQPVPTYLHGRFDCIFDGGTIEHVFNVPAALANVHAMLRPGGLFLSVNAANNQLGHGFYQFSPELMWRVFSREAGYEVEAMYLMDLAGLPTPRVLTDPEVLGRRDEIGPTAGPTYLMVAARKTANAALAAVQQSDYARTWLAAGAGG